MGVGLARRGLAYAFFTNSRLGILVNGIAVDRSGCLSIGAGRCAVQFTLAFVCEMITGCTSRNDARSVQANTSRGMGCRVTVQTLCAAVLVMVNTGIVHQAFIASAGTDDTLPILTKFIRFARRVALAAVQRIAFELVFWQTRRFRIGTTIDHAIVA